MLLTAAGLKLQQFATDAIPEGGLFSGYWLRILAMEIEVSVATALMAGFWPRVTRRACQGLFFAFLVISLINAAFGVKSCACLGAIEMQPLIMALLDAAVLVALSVWRPVQGPTRNTRLAFTLAAAFPLSLIPAWTFLAAETAALPVAISPALIDLGTIAQGQKRQFTVILRNRLDKPVKIERADASCPCVELIPIKVELAPFEDLAVQLAFDLGNDKDFVGSLVIEIRGWAGSGEALFAGEIKVHVVANQ